MTLIKVIYYYLQWDEFSIPELENFLRILDREEEEYVEQVKARYSLLRIQVNSSNFLS